MTDQVPSLLFLPPFQSFPLLVVFFIHPYSASLLHVASSSLLSVFFSSSPLFLASSSSRYYLIIAKHSAFVCTLDSVMVSDEATGVFLFFMAVGKCRYLSSGLCCVHLCEWMGAVLLQNWENRCLLLQLVGRREMRLVVR